MRERKQSTALAGGFSLFLVQEARQNLKLTHQERGWRERVLWLHFTGPWSESISCLSAITGCS